jgi:magnesium transporter
MEKILLINEISQIENYIDKYSMTQIINGQVGKFESHAKFNLLSFDWHDIKAPYELPSQIIIHFSEQSIFFICENERSLNKVNGIFNKDDSIEKTIYNFFAELIKEDTNFIEILEEDITETEDALLTGAKRDCAIDIITYRRELLQLKKYYEQLNTIFEGLVDNENNLISKDRHRYFTILDSRIDRLFSNVLNIRDYVNQVREAYQAQIDIEQNNLMRIFTVITSIFLPLTLIAGWYGMNLKMPEFSWDYGYPFVIGLSLLISIICLIIFKRKKWF